jgi:3-dehydroquinate synthase
MILNFGHTVGHALETETHYKHFLHGEAVGWGMIAAANIAARMGKTDEQTARRIIDLVQSYGPLPAVKVNPRNIIKRLTRDKKTIHGKVHFILPTALGKVEIDSNVPERVLINAVEELKHLSHA